MAPRSLYNHIWLILNSSNHYLKLFPTWNPILPKSWMLTIFIFECSLFLQSQKLKPPKIPYDIIKIWRKETKRNTKFCGNLRKKLWEKTRANFVEVWKISWKNVKKNHLWKRLLYKTKISQCMTAFSIPLTSAYYSPLSLLNSTDSKIPVTFYD